MQRTMTCLTLLLALATNAIAEESVKEKARKKEYTGGCVISKRTFKYGYYEA